MKKLKNLLKYKYLIFLFILLLTILRTNIKQESIYNINDQYFTGTIIDYQLKEDYITFVIKTPEKIKCNYYIKNNENINFKYGDKIYLKGNLKIPSNNTIPNIFNYKRYLKNNSIYYILNIEKIISIERTDNIFYKIKNLINNRINKIDKRGYLNTFILGDKSYLDNEVYNSYKVNGILHIFSISGMHISILSSIILLILNKVKQSKFNILTVIIFLFFYIILTNYQASIVRSIIFFTILNLNKILKLKLKTVDCLLISISIILLGG